MTKSIKCHSCGKPIRADSHFCRHCGAQIPLENPEISHEEETLVRQSALLKTDIKTAVDACHQYREHYPDGAAAIDIDLTNSIILSLLTMYQVAQNQPFTDPTSETYTGNAKLSEQYFSNTFHILKNGIVIDLRIADKKKREFVLASLTSWQQICETLLDRAFKEAEEEKNLLLVDGKTQAAIKQKTLEDCYNDAEVFYQFYTEEKYDEAIKGFEYLKELNPMDAYFRNMLGACFTEKGRTLDAIREYVYGYYLDPGEPHLAASLIRVLTASHLHGAAYALFCHFQQYGQNGKEDAHRTVELLGNTAMLCSQGLISVLADISEQDYDPNTSNVMDDFRYTEKPWLRAPPQVKAGTPAMLHDKRIFISYRRSDCAAMATKIRAHLKADFPSLDIFLDKSSMVGGEAFTEQLREVIDNCDVFLLLISPYWRHKNGIARIKETSDILRRELLRALGKDKSIVPVLINGGKIPEKSALPKDLYFIRELHAVHVDDETFSTDIGALESNLTTVLTNDAIRKKVIDDDLNRIEALLETDYDAYEKELETLFERGKDELRTYVPATAKHDEGIPLDKIDVFGIWESIAVGPNGAKCTIDIDIEDQTGSVYSGTLHTVDTSGNVLADMELSGNWSEVLDVDKNRFLGFSLTYITPENTSAKLYIPFHSKIGHQYVGDDEYGLHYSTRNIEPRTGGF